MGELSPTHWIIVLLLFALLFGSKRLPDAARGLGRSLRIFKAEMRSANEETPSAGEPSPGVGQPTPGVGQPSAPPAPTAAQSDAVPPQPMAIPPAAVAPVTAPPMVLSDQVRPVAEH